MGSKLTSPPNQGEQDNKESKSQSERDGLSFQEDDEVSETIYKTTKNCRPQDGFLSGRRAPFPVDQQCSQANYADMPYIMAQVFIEEISQGVKIASGEVDTTALGEGVDEVVDRIGR